MTLKLLWKLCSTTCCAFTRLRAVNSRLVSSIAQHIAAYPIGSSSHIIPLHHSAWCLSAGCALAVRCASIQCTQREFKCRPSLSCSLPKASSVLATHTLSLNDQSASLEVKREGGPGGPSVTKEPRPIGCIVKCTSASSSQHSVAVCECLIIIKQEQLRWTAGEEIGADFRHSHDMQYS